MDHRQLEMGARVVDREAAASRRASTIASATEGEQRSGRRRPPAGWSSVAGDDRRQVRRPGRDRQREDRQQEWSARRARRSSSRGSLPCRRTRCPGRGRQAPGTRCRAAAANTTANRSPTWSSAETGGQNGTMPRRPARRWRPARAAPATKTQLVFAGTIRSLASSLRMSRHGWVTGGTGAALEAGPHRAHDADEQRRAGDDEPMIWTTTATSLATLIGPPPARR